MFFLTIELCVKRLSNLDRNSVFVVANQIKEVKSEEVSLVWIVSIVMLFNLLSREKRTIQRTTCYENMKFGQI